MISKEIIKNIERKDVNISDFGGDYPFSVIYISNLLPPSKIDISQYTSASDFFDHMLISFAKPKLKSKMVFNFPHESDLMKSLDFSAKDLIVSLDIIERKNKKSFFSAFDKENRVAVKKRRKLIENIKKVLSEPLALYALYIAKYPENIKENFLKHQNIKVIDSIFNTQELIYAINTKNNSFKLEKFEILKSDLEYEALLSNNKEHHYGRKYNALNIDSAAKEKRLEIYLLEEKLSQDIVLFTTNNNFKVFSSKK